MILNPKTQALKARAEEAIKDLHQFAVETGRQELAATVGELRNRMNEPFLFVVVGEVKAGKSSFINALLQTSEDICPAAPQPLTDTIRQIFYGEQKKETRINPFLCQVALPEPILRDIAVVDTPGTNSIVAQHQEITERFVPASDLVIFVFEAKNPYRQSAWDFFEYIHSDWHKKVAFVLQQKDLISPEDLAVNERGLYEFARKKGIPQPIIFATSARAEQEGRYNQSGFSQVRDFIRSHVTGGRGAALKIANNLQAALDILTRIRSDLDARFEQYRLDRNFRADIDETLNKQEAKSNYQAELLVENILNGYDHICRDTAVRLNAELSFPSLLKRSVMGIFSKQSSIQERLEDLARHFELRLDAELRAKLNDGVLDLADSIQQMAKLIDLKIGASSTVVKSDAYIFEAVAEKRVAVLRELQDAFGRFISRAENFSDERLFPENTRVTPGIAAGSGIAAIGVVLAAVTNLAVFDITGGVLASVGVLFAGVSAGIQRRKLMRGFEEETARGRALMRKTLAQKLGHYIRSIKGRIAANFDELDLLLEQEERQLAALNARFEDIRARVQVLNKEIGALIDE